MDTPQSSLRHVLDLRQAAAGKQSSILGLMTTVVYCSMVLLAVSYNPVPATDLAATPFIDHANHALFLATRAARALIDHARDLCYKPRLQLPKKDG